LKGCQRLYGPDVRQDAPSLGYYLPALTAEGASGEGRVKEILPAYTCNPLADKGTQAHRLLPAVPDSGPRAKLEATKVGRDVTAIASVDGDGPLSIRWSSSSVALPQ